MINIGIMIDYHSAFNNNNNIIAFIVIHIFVTVY